MKTLTQPLYITSSCTLRADRIAVDGKLALANTEGHALGSWLKDAYQYLGMDYPKFYKMDALAKATLLAAEWISKSVRLGGSNTPLVLSNYSSSIVSDAKHAAGIFDSEDPTVSPATFVYTLPNIAMGEVAIRHQLHSENVFFIFERFTPEFLVPYVEGLFERGGVQQVLAGWVEVGTSDTCDVLLYAVSQRGETLHTLENLNELYTKHYE